MGGLWLVFVQPFLSLSLMVCTVTIASLTNSPRETFSYHSNIADFAQVKILNLFGKGKTTCWHRPSPPDRTGRDRSGKSPETPLGINSAHTTTRELAADSLTQIASCVGMCVSGGRISTKISEGRPPILQQKKSRFQ